MPANSKKQLRFMQAIAHGWKPSGKNVPSKAQAKEFVSGQTHKDYKKLPETKKSDITKLIKAFERRDGITLVDPREHYGALQAVNGRVLEWLKDATKDMKIDDAKDIPMFVKGGVLKIRKVMDDMYSGHIIDKAGDINHLFDRLTLPSMASQIMSVYEIYDGSADDKLPELRSLKEEISNLNGELKGTKGKPALDVESRIKSIIDSIDRLTTSHEKVKSTHDKLVDKVESEINVVHEKLKDLKGKLDEKSSVAPEAAVVAHKVGEPGQCEDCGASPCVCFSHLPRPVIELDPSGKLKIFFKSEFSEQDKLNWLKAMRLVVDKKRGQRSSK